MRQSREGRAASRAAQVALALRRVEVVRTYLALDDPAQFRPRTVIARMGGMRVHRLTPFPPELYRRLYRDVGERWFWRDRLAWSDAQLRDHLDRSDVAVHVMTGSDGTHAGFFELRRHEDGSVEIAYFGLLPENIGHGLGADLLKAAVKEAWALGAERVWLHTCTLDSPHALPNYEARGFRAFKTERYEVEMD